MPPPVPLPTHHSPLVVIEPPVIVTMPCVPGRPRIVLPLTLTVPPLWFQLAVPPLPSSRPIESQPPTLTVPASRLTVPVPPAAAMFKSLWEVTLPVVLMLNTPVAGAPLCPDT